MNDSLATRPSLLVRIRDAHDTPAWGEFVRLYGPLVYAFAKKHGLQDADASDLTQEVLHAVSRAISRWDYDVQRGGFRHWLFTVTRHELADLMGRANRQPPGSGDTQMKERLDQLPQPEESRSLWDQHYDRRLLEWAAKRVRQEVRESTWQAFWQTAVEGKSAEEVALALDMSVGAVYIAKSRIIARLRQQVEGH